MLHRVVVDCESYIKGLSHLTKDLHDNEVLCQRCQGTGIVISDNPFGTKDNKDHNLLPMFPYVNQSIMSCPDCYNGVLRKCEYCGTIMPRYSLKCGCAYQKKIDSEKAISDMKLALEKAQIAPKDIEDATNCFYSDDFPENDGYFFDWQEFFDSWNDNHPEDDPRPEYVWATDAIEPSLDAADIVEQMTDDLYEDAAYDVSDQKVAELQTYLDNFCKTCGVNSSYWKSSKYKIKIPWEQK